MTARAPSPRASANVSGVIGTALIVAVCQGVAWVTGVELGTLVAVWALFVVVRNGLERHAHDRALR
jgi:hypothetical protein